MFLEIKAGEQQLILCGSDTTSVFEDWKVASERPRSSTKHVGPAFSLCGSAIKWMMCAVDRELISRGQNPLFLPWVYSSRSDEEKMRILSGVSEPVHRKLIRFGYKALSDEERLSLLGDNSPLTAEALGRDILDNPFFKDSETNRDSDAYKAAEAIAKFEGKVLGALLTKANQGDIIQLDIGKGEALDNPYWTETERSIVRGTTYALIGGSIGTKGRFSELLRFRLNCQPRYRFVIFCG